MEKLRHIQSYFVDQNFIEAMKFKLHNQMTFNPFKLDTYKSNSYKTLGGSSDQRIDKAEEWKRKEWVQWMMKLEVDWKEFNLQIEAEKKAWIDEKEQEWIQWLKYEQKKWLHFNPNLDSEYKINFFEKSETWDDSQWKLWISTEGKQLLEVDLKNWLSENETIYCKWTLDEWNEWKNNKIKEWITTNWKVNEDQYWSKYDDVSALALTPLEKNQFYKWKERIFREGIEWKNWSAIKESKYINSNWNAWSEWKNEKLMLFNHWVNSFVEKWVRQRQWNVWIDERKNMLVNEKTTGETVREKVGLTLEEKLGEKLEEKVGLTLEEKLGEKLEEKVGVTPASEILLQSASVQ
ncbi:uncharacterized protein MKS88_000326 [Plasmodium brasilianum]|uniref:Tryptophan-rich protein n=1 Tax=Plasmodium malariae TaxID=5858 RepID=A0A1D3JKI8_PLAMA|nr:tryptophan-rich protein [Plasmodium malariae]KAI4833837.1 hypothetical protein MKS88_000326 [Plasmodium brasilianum]SBT87068.1 tryptophan-rich protein [Plasmodium malariae]